VKENYIKALNGPTVQGRLEALKVLAKLVKEGKITYAPDQGYVNNHIHTTYSFSPYSPTQAVWQAKMAGLQTAGIVDHDAIGGAEEFYQAGRILDIATTTGVEFRISLAGTAFENKRLNNTAQEGVAYVAMHGIPRTKISAVEAFIAPFREKRNLRNRKMVDRLNTLLEGIQLDFEQDIMPLSESDQGGSITERHLLFALALKLIDAYGKGKKLVQLLESKMGIEIKGVNRKYLEEAENPYYAYDLLGALKGKFVDQFYIPATEECPDVATFIAKAKEIGAIAAYAYLGDVKNSVTGDKEDAVFEDAYIKKLFDYLEEVGFTAITYMPSRNTQEQLINVRKLCQQHQFFQISGEDINSPRQAFTCEALLQPEFANLIEATWAMIGHENQATIELEQGMFSQRTKEKMPRLEDRIKYYAQIAQEK